MCLCTSCIEDIPEAPPQPPAPARTCEWCVKEPATMTRPLRGLAQDLHLCASCEKVVVRQIHQGHVAKGEAGVL
jgi:hypothetical protein